MKVVCCTMFSPSHNELANISVPNLREYAERHGYDVRIIMVENDKWEYQKHEAFARYFNEGVDLIWYKDVDALITNHKVKVEDFVDGNAAVFITEDIHELNGGSIVIKNNWYGRAFNDDVLSRRGEFQNEQNVYNYLRRFYEGGIMKVLPHPSLNSYDYSLYPEYPNIRSREQGHWHEGDFLLHTPGAPMEVRLNTLKNATIIR